ncbi:MAG: hypothetical protein H5T84_05435, partial [Thermoleophilia bacterium]|nr:hypothetical protein [Thermoleophilia bacterium]
MKTSEPTLFREVQRFRQWIFWLPVIAVTTIIWWQFVEQVIRRHPQGSEPLPDWAAWVLTLVFGLGFPAFAALVRLITEVRSGELVVQLFPFRPKVIPLDTVASAQVREYSPIREFGGWGVRVSLHGRAYNAYGTRGVQLVLTDGSRVLIGSQRPEELEAALRLAGLRPRS